MISHRALSTQTKLIAAGVLAALAFAVGLWLWHRPGPPRPHAHVATIGGAGMKIEAGRLPDYFGVAVNEDDEVYFSDGTANAIHRLEDGAAKQVTAELAMPSAIAFAPDESLIVANTGSHTIVRVDVDSGRVEAIAGAAGASGAVDGKGAEARFNGPIGIAVAADGRIFVADTYNDRIREIAEDGTVRTIAGGAQGFRDGAGVEAMFDTPCGLAVEKDGALLVADTGNHRIRRIAPDGGVTTIAGIGQPWWRDGAPLEAGFNEPMAIAIRRDGAIFIADAGNDCVRMLAAEQKGGPLAVTTIAGSFPPGLMDGALSGCRLNHPTTLAFDADHALFFADQGNGLIRALVPIGAKRGFISKPGLAISAEEIRRAVAPRWPYDPPDAKRDVAGTFGEIRGEISPDAEAWFHNGFDIPGGYGETARAIFTESVTRPLPIEGAGTGRERLRLPLLGYTHIRFGRDQNDQPLNNQPEGAIAFRRDAEGRVIGVRVRRGTRFNVGDALGTLNRMNHVHLIAGPIGGEINALTALQFPNLADATPPTIEGVTIASEQWETLYDSSVKAPPAPPAVRGNLRIVVRAFDQVDGTARHRRLGLYRLSYQRLAADGAAATPLQYNLVFDRLPGDPSAISLVYAPGSQSGYQGSTVFNYIATNELRDGQARERFLEMGRLPAGEYRLLLLAEDFFGNQTRREVAIRHLP
ncbi:MAG: SMP-30/gluconolactonase/LRE family protein [Blastocatellia bacterium]|nr:SMP-30/gluconolactonase/LRE family protein [Blastocatellia bacterium]